MYSISIPFILGGEGGRVHVRVPFHANMVLAHMVDSGPPGHGRAPSLFAGTCQSQTERQP